MGMQSDIKALFSSATLLTAVNTALSAATLEQVSTAQGIFIHPLLIPNAPKWPCLYIEGPVWEQTEWSSGTEREITGTVDVSIQIAAKDPVDLILKAPLYGDIVRSVYEQIGSPLLRIECTSGNADGEPVEVESHAHPVREITQTFEFTARYVKGQP